MQNVPVDNSSPSGNAGYVSHTATTVPATHQIQPATSLGQQPGNNAYFSSVQVVDPAAAFPFNIDPVNQNLTGYPTAMAPPPAINNFDPSQLALPLDAYQPRVEFPEHFFVNHQPMAPLPEAAAGLSALAHGTDRNLRQQPPSMTPRDAPLLCKWEGSGKKSCFDMSKTSISLLGLSLANFAIGDSTKRTIGQPICAVGIGWNGLRECIVREAEGLART
ncbi:uncharacterized protein BO88DRAFT_436327 [Aspergillus vadensis CBS 113365]|uniref:Uncharacterized protein n=1 Tax=Aspergillus vadensis (strain CBS 113365 / IMI 142717 / IBT 24658) TaxID=1448311 RepID=A0A319BXV0_ASPVC|nr:hypothetical protein BO88DRAFT_436327 [Aspergillus vadensis CBS 113365]PYH67948.1 hypothetical protein BO88DRAFT_436327 [Aspergillus vadensis CBS 113365]